MKQKNLLELTGEENKASDITKEEIERYQRQFLLHSFIYYRLDDALIDDKKFDRRVEKLFDLMKCDIAKNTKYYDYCKKLDKSLSGYFIKEYPTEIKSTALRLLYKEKGIEDKFEDFIRKYGYYLI